MRLIIPTIISVAIMAGMGVGYGWWLTQDEEYVVVDIDALMEEGQALSVYAQFVVTQTIEIKEMAEITRILLPVHLTRDWPEWLIILRQGDKEIDRWTLSEADRKLMPGNNVASFSLSSSRLMDGRAEVEVNGSMIDHRFKDDAPEVFIQRQDDYYVDGNYRIADNEKAGDMAMEIRAKRSRWQAAMKKYEQNKFSLIPWAAARLTLILVVSSFPVVMMGGRFRLG